MPERPNLSVRPSAARTALGPGERLELEQRAAAALDHVIVLIVLVGHVEVGGIACTVPVCPREIQQSALILREETLQKKVVKIKRSLQVYAGTSKKHLIVFGLFSIT